MALHTASEIISFEKRLEEESAQFYHDLAQRYGKDEEMWLALAKENKRTIEEIERAYLGVITDALEGCFGFNMDADQYMPDTQLAEEANYRDAVAKAVEIEERMVKFYSDGAEQGKSLLADVPRRFAMVAKKRANDRLPKLRSLIEKRGE